MSTLTTYQKKRNFADTSESKGKEAKTTSFRFVVQRHQASHLHYDFRLELGGVLKSWAVPKGPSLNPSQKRLAVMVEDHPVDYIKFHGKIPEGNYGAGIVEIWDKGTFTPLNAKHEIITERQALQAIKKGELKFMLKGKKLNGEFVLVNLKQDKKNWLLIKHKDEYASQTIYNAEDELKKKVIAKPVSSIRGVKAKKISTYIKPMLAHVSKTAFDDKEFLFEIKWDGYRAIAEWNKKDFKFYSRNGIDFTERFPSIANDLKKLKHNVILDGEIIVLNEKNLPDFQKLQHYENNMSYPLVYYVFDILMLDNKDTTELELIKRKELVKHLLKNNKTIRYCDHIEEKGISFFNTAKEQGLEGIIAKNKYSLYAKGYRSREWLKIKSVQSTEAVIIGYTNPAGSRKHFGALVLANKKGNSFTYRGHVGTGFNEVLLASLKKMMKPLETNVSPFKERVPLNNKVTWLKPKLVADIGYTEITRDGIFRHPVFLRLRDEKKAGSFNDESAENIQPVHNDTEKKVGKDRVMLTNQHKIFWPDEGYTKVDLINYYDSISKYILPHLKNRPLSLKRNPNGIRDEGFFHKDAGENAPAYATVYPVKSESKKVIDYIVCNNKATLLYLANLGCIEINPWNSTTAAPDKPTWMVIDIDPSDKNTFEEVIDAALVTKEVLDKAGLQSFCKTSGATGLHVYVPFKNKYDYSIIKDFAMIVATLVHEQLPDTTSIERSLRKRGPHVYIDFLQNRSGQTLCSVYSLRPRPGAPASTPLHWNEVKSGLHPAIFNISNILERVTKKGDLFHQVLNVSGNIERAIKLLSGK